MKRFNSKKNAGIFEKEILNNDPYTLISIQQSDNDGFWYVSVYWETLKRWILT